jgi:hypothetical protein
MEDIAMNWTKLLTDSALVATLVAATVAHAEGQKVTALLDDSINVYAQKADYFVKQQQVARSELTLPTPVLAESDKGYVKVSQQGKEMWLDLTDVTVRPPKGLGDSRCVKTGLGNIAKTGRGAGEPCL